MLQVRISGGSRGHEGDGGLQDKVTDLSIKQGSYWDWRVREVQSWNETAMILSHLSLLLYLFAIFS